ncbi:MAG: hypothetical protein H6Q89_768 [Myxococcaceae bacterium]|nr:hypothetical protein [Myxococcaceae bacterium]
MCAVAPALADSPGPAPTGPQAWRSEGGRFVFEVTPPPSRSAREATAEGRLLESGRELWKQPLPNRVSPASALVSADGKYVATFDDWGNVGEGPNVVVLFGPGGKQLARLGLDALVSNLERQRLPRSVSNTWWSGMMKGAGHRFDLAQKRLVLRIALGGNVPPIYDQGPTKEVFVSLVNGRVEGRGVDAPTGPSDLEKRLRATADLEERQELLALVSESGAAVLRPFLLELINDPSQAPLHSQGYALLHQGGTDDDWLALAKRQPRSAELDRELVLAALRRKLVGLEPAVLAVMRAKGSSDVERTDALRGAFQVRPSRELIEEALASPSVALRRQGMELFASVADEALFKKVLAAGASSSELTVALDSVLGSAVFAPRAKFRAQGSLALAAEVEKPGSALLKGRPDLLYALAVTLEDSPPAARAEQMFARCLEAAKNPVRGGWLDQIDFGLTCEARLLARRVMAGQAGEREVHQLAARFQGKKACHPIPFEREFERCKWSTAEEIETRLTALAQSPLGVRVEAKAGELKVVVQNRSAQPLVTSGSFKVSTRLYSRGASCQANENATSSSPPAVFAPQQKIELQLKLPSCDGGQRVELAVDLWLKEKPSPASQRAWAWVE